MTRAVARDTVASVTTARFVVSPTEDGQTVAALLRTHLAGLAWSRARKLVETGKVCVDGDVLRDPARRLPTGAVVELDERAPKLRGGTLAHDAIVFVDHHVVVVRKPAGVLSVPYSEGDRDTLVDQTRAALRRLPSRKGGARYDPMLGVVHRLDKDTTGLLVFARTLAAKRHLEQQFRTRRAGRLYLALVHGGASDARYDTMLIANRGDGLRGSHGVFRRATGGPKGDAKRAITNVEVLERFGRDGQDASLVRCRLRTGRQHQIRIHLSEAGHPLLGEPVYIRDFAGPRIDAPRPMLHATSLSFDHPLTEERVSFEDAPPEDFQSVLSRLRER